MTQEVVAVDELIVNAPGYVEGRVVSVLEGGKGLAALSGQMARRTGRRPAASGVELTARRLTLKSAFMSCVDSEWRADRLAWLMALNSERGVTKRLVAGDTVPPQDWVLGLGPWDAYADDNGDWYVREILRRATATLTGAVHFEAGCQDRQRAIVIEKATTNLIDNPSFEIDTTNWIGNGAATIARDTTEYKYGQASVKVTCTAVASDGIRRSALIAIAPSTTYTLSTWFKGIAGQSYTLRFDGDVSGLIASQAFVATGGWQRADVTGTMGAGDSTARPMILNTSAVAHVFYADASQFEQKDYVTTYCDGSLGPGYAWAGTPHASTSTRTATEVNLDDEVGLVSEQEALTFRVVAQMPYDHDGAWPQSDNPLFAAVSGSNEIRLTYRTFDDKFKLQIGITFSAESTAQTFDAGDWVDLVVTIDFTNDNYKIYVDGALEGTDTGPFSPQAAAGWKLGSNATGTAQSNFTVAEFYVWQRVLGAGEVAGLYSAGATCGRARAVDVLCEGSERLVLRGQPTERGEVATLVVDKDVRWRGRDGGVHFWQPADDTWETTVTVDSDEFVRPVVRITPRDTKSSGFQYRRWVAIVWKAAAASQYGTLIGPIDTTGLVSGSKMQADGDDWRVQVDGVEVDRWFGAASGSPGGPNSTTTKTWINLDFEAAGIATLAANIGSGDTVTEIEATDDIAGFPSSGLLLINAEAFAYTGKSNKSKKFTGVTRAQRGTSAGSHTAGNSIYWLQHDVYILYGDAAASAPTVDDDYKPIFELDTSTNSSWVYEEFGENDGLRSAAWSKATNLTTSYTANHLGNADPWEEIGLDVYGANGWGRWYLYNPCGITNMQIPTNQGEKYAELYASSYDARIQSSANGSSWTTEYSIPAPSTTGVWETWDRNEALTSGAKYAALYVTEYGYRVEASEVTLTLGPDTPAVTIGSEQGNYPLAVVIENETTGEAIELTYTMAVDETLEVDTELKLVRHLVDGSRQMQALGLVGGARDEWLRLEPGENLLTWDDAGTEEVDVEMVWDRRYLE